MFCWSGSIRDRTVDLLNANQTLSQLSYGPLRCFLVFNFSNKSLYYLVGPSGLEPLTSRLSGVCSNQLSYRPGLCLVVASSMVFHSVYAWNNR